VAANCRRGGPEEFGWRSPKKVDAQNELATMMMRIGGRRHCTSGVPMSATSKPVSFTSTSLSIKIVNPRLWIGMAHPDA
jgi:hypothetical protein